MHSSSNSTSHQSTKKKQRTPLQDKQNVFTSSTSSLLNKRQSDPTHLKIKAPISKSLNPSFLLDTIRESTPTPPTTSTQSNLTNSNQSNLFNSTQLNLVNSKQSNLGNSNQSNLFISNQSSLFDKEKKGQLHEFKETLESRLALYRSTLESNHTLQTNLNDTCDLIEYCLANTSLFHQIDTHQDSLYLPEGIEKEVMDERKDEMNDEMVERDLLEMRIIQVEGELLVKEDRIRELEEALKYTLDENEQLYSLYHKKSAQ